MAVAALLALIVVAPAAGTPSEPPEPPPLSPLLPTGDGPWFGSITITERITSDTDTRIYRTTLTTSEDGDPSATEMAGGTSASVRSQSTDTFGCTQIHEGSGSHTFTGVFLDAFNSSGTEWSFQWSRGYENTLFGFPLQASGSTWNPFTLECEPATGSIFFATSVVCCSVEIPGGVTQQAIVGAVSNVLNSSPGFHHSATYDVALRRQACDHSVDTDSDGLSDCREYELGTKPNDHDTDGDGLSDGDEAERGTNPLDGDSDDDGLGDGVEVNTYATNPLVSDTDGDGMSDGQEVEQGTNPLVPDLPPPPQPVRECDTYRSTWTASFGGLERLMPLEYHLFTFSPSVTYCYDGVQSEILSAAVLGSADSGLDEAVLEALGFTSRYDPTSESVTWGQTANFTGTFEMVFDWTVLLDRTKAGDQLRDKAFEKAEQQLAKRLRKIIGNRGYNSADRFAVADTIAQWGDDFAKKLDRGLAELLSERPARWLRADLKDQFETWAKEAINSQLSAFNERVAQVLQTSEGDPAELIAAEATAILKAKIEERLTWTFDVWSPSVAISVTPAGEISEHIAPTGANPLLVITRG